MVAGQDFNRGMNTQTVKLKDKINCLGLKAQNCILMF